MPGHDRERRILLRGIAMLAGVGLLSPAVHAGAYEDFFHGVRVDQESMVRKQVQRGFDPNAVWEDGQPALLLALREENERVAEYLASLPQLDVEARNPAGETALMMALLKGMVPLAQKLLARGAKVQYEPGRWSPIHYAASHGGQSGLEVVLAAGADLNARSPNGSTPLMMAARYGSEEGTELLLRRGADPRLKNDKGLGAADFARTAQRDELAARIEQLAAARR